MKNVNPKTFIIANIILLIVLIALSGCSWGAEDVSAADEAAGAQRAIQNKGSDTLVNLALAWAERYREIDPSVSIAVTGGGSGTGIASLINGTVDIANASRKMKEKEITAAQENGIDPIEFTVAIDALFSPVKKVNYVVTNARVGQQTDYDKLTLEIWTDGSV